MSRKLRVKIEFTAPGDTEDVKDLTVEQIEAEFFKAMALGDNEGITDVKLKIEEIAE